MPDKMKVYELAKNLGVTSVFLMDKIRREWKLPVKSHMEAITPELVKKIKKRFQGEQVKKSVTTTGRKKITRSPKKNKVSIKASSPLSNEQDPVVKRAVKNQKKETAPQKSSENKTVKKIIRRKKADQPEITPLSPETGKKGQTVSAIPEEETAEVKKKEQMEDKFSAPSLDKLWDISREEKKPPKKPSSEKVTHSKFQAADFRKREVIFQPKKKRLVVSGEARKTQNHCS